MEGLTCSGLQGTGGSDREQAQGEAGPVEIAMNMVRHSGTLCMVIMSYFCFASSVLTHHNQALLTEVPIISLLQSTVSVSIRAALCLPLLLRPTAAKEGNWLFMCTFPVYFIYIFI
jgi:hypothetical protein